MELTMQNAKKVLEKYLKENNAKKYEHSKRVAIISKQLAKKWDISQEEAVIASLLHDIGKSVSKREMLDICSRNNVIIHDFEIFENTESLHGEVSKIILNKEFEKASNSERFDRIQSAVAKHVTGAEQMSDLDKVVFIADNIEPSKKNYDIFVKIQSGEIESMDECIKLIIERKQQRAGLKNMEINPLLINTKQSIEEDTK